MFEMIIISMVISALAYAIAPKPKIETPIAGTLDIPAPKLGEPIPVIFGEVWMDNAAISYYGNSSTQAIKADGGK